jgi:aminoglycoside phosphotransferase family enzyme/predicted kinase
MSPAETSQQAVIDFLGDPATHGGAAVKRIDTHAATVFLAGKRALKIKRAVRFPVLDYSTLDRRKAACAAELEVNHPYAPAIYRRAVAITREDDGTLAIGGAGMPVEWAVEMRRFDETQTLDHLAAAERIDGALAEALGRAVARAHAAAPAVANAGFIDALAEIIAQNDAELRAAPELFPPRAVSALTAATRGAFARVRALLIARERAGRVARCHGDLHLGNIVLLDGAPVLFDAIEFDPKIATGDVLYDLAFLLMDLIERGLTPAANIVLNRYLNETQRVEDLDALAALPLFLSLRASIRAKVAAERWAQGGERTRVEQSARDYFALAGKLLAPPPPMLLAVGGLSGTGKSLLARALAAEILPEPGAVVLRSDVERKVLFGVAEGNRLSQAAYAREFTAQVYGALVDKARRVIAAGHSAIIDAVFADEGERAAIAQAAPADAFHGLFMTADLTTRLARVGGRKGDASDADASIARSQEQYDLGAMQWTPVDASGSAEETLRRTKAALGLA